MEKKLNVPSYQVRIGDVITIKERLKESTLYKTLVEEFGEFARKNQTASVTSVRWLTVDPKKLSITMNALPEPSDFEGSSNKYIYLRNVLTSFFRATKFWSSHRKSIRIGYGMNLD